MKALLSLAILGVGLTTSGQDVFVLGGPGSAPVPPIVYSPPVVATPAPAYQQVQPAVAVMPFAPVAAVVPVVPVAPAAPVYATTYSSYAYNGYGYNPNVIYIGGPGSCGPNYYNYSHCAAPNVIYFGSGQAYRQGYNFRHCR